MKTPLLDEAIKTRHLNHEGKPRRIGVEIELGGLNGAEIAEKLAAELDGSVERVSSFEFQVAVAELGSFKIELDSDDIKSYGESADPEGKPKSVEDTLKRAAVETVGNIAEQLVPWEIVSPPLRLDEVNQLFGIIEALRLSGAKGTNGAFHNAFGVHLNPELGSLEAGIILNHLRAYFCLYELLFEQEQPDLVRRLSPYINHFDDKYILHVLTSEYQPDIKQLIGDYIEHNPTRNRSLDMLPMFKFLDKDRVESEIGDGRINSRPTFHYRLPNCEIDETSWNLDRCLEGWMLVEILAIDSDLENISNSYSEHLEKGIFASRSDWLEEISSWVQKNLEEQP